MVGMKTSRRHFLQSSLAVAVGFRGLHRLLADSADLEQSAIPGYGPLIADPAGILDLPRGFSYKIFSVQRSTMDDGFRVPGKHDGMGSFAGPDGKTILVRNHEMMHGWTAIGPYGEKNELYNKVPREMFWDARRGNEPCLGATTTLVYNTKTQELEKHFLSLAGTQFNCAGGVTPWGTWITCEENTARANDEYEQDHGYPFEVPALADGGLTKPVPIKAMGRFRREAVAVDPNTGIVYQTEDINDGIITRYIPNKPGELLAGGKLQALCVAEKPTCDMRNWTEEDGKPIPYLEFPVNCIVGVKWIDLDEVHSPADDLRHRAAAQGAAVFARAEGIWYGNDAVYIACTNGGRIGAGQVYKYVPSPHEGKADETKTPGKLELFLEPNDRTMLENADNIVVAPWGDLVLCEDGKKDDFLVGVTPGGEIYKLARNTQNTAEFAGSCFSPDGSTLFVNVQGTGTTFAITGPWEKRQHAML